MPELAHMSETKINRRKPIFAPSNWQHIFKLLGLIIVADGKIRKEEVDTYLDVVMELRAVIDPTVSLTRHMAKDWFILNKSDLEDIIVSLAYDSALIDILKEVRSMPHKLDVITGMVKIAVADGHYADVEKGLIKKTILYWNISAKDETDVQTSFYPAHSETL